MPLEIRVTPRVEQTSNQLVVKLEIRPDPDPGMDMVSYPDATTEALRVAVKGTVLPVRAQTYVPRVWGGEIALVLDPVDLPYELEISCIVRVRNLDGTYREWRAVSARNKIVLAKD
jgi:hypothetical protein